jgi:two-component system sensor histidine kinase BaeS
MRIQNKLFAIFFLSSTLLVVSLVLFIQWTMAKGMVEYVNARQLRDLQPLAQQLAKLYQREKSWNSLRGEHRGFMRLIDSNLLETQFQVANGQPPPRGFDRKHPPPRRSELQGKEELVNKQPDAKDNGFPHNRPPPGGPGRGPEVSYALLDLDKLPVVGRYLPELSYSFIDIMLEQRKVGYVAVSKRDHLVAGYELNFVNQQKSYLLLIALALLAMTLLIILPLAKHLIKPIRQLAEAMSRLTQGDYQQRLELNRKDEFSRLSRDFNELAMTLQRNKVARRRWLADISHELRTPVAVLKAEIEAILDGVRPLSMGQIESANDELKQLERLIEDLQELSRSELGAMGYRKSELELLNFLTKQVTKYQHILEQQDIQLSLYLPESRVRVFADPERLHQLFANVCTNIAKYAGQGSKAYLSLGVENGLASIIIEDNGPGVEEQHLAQLFDHLYRVENSRNRETGGSGLGLSICKQIVEAHQGEIFATRSGRHVNRGLAIHIHIPLLK